MQKACGGGQGGWRVNRLLLVRQRKHSACRDAELTALVESRRKL